jgi:lysophospholipase L1-like esterase
MLFRAARLCLLTLFGFGGAPPPAIAEHALAPPVPTPAPMPAPSAAPSATVNASTIDLSKVHSVLHIGDSEVGYASGLCKDLGARFKAQSIAYYSESWTSEGLKNADTDGKIEKALAAHKADLVLLNLGTNNLASPSPQVLGPLVASIAKKLAGQRCIWIGPPHLPSAGKLEEPVVKVIAAHAAPCHFYDSLALALQLQPDNIHPNGKGAQVWAENLWNVLVLQKPAPGPFRL